VNYRLRLSAKAEKESQDLRKSDTAAFNKLMKLFRELEMHPLTGTGKPEALRYLPGYYSRRIDKKNRLIYHVNAEAGTVRIISAKGHYDD
jgi:toxin YoeB